MANEYGPTVEPGWIGGAKMPGQPDLVGNFMNAWQLGVAANAKERYYQNMVAQMQLKGLKMQQDSQQDAFKNEMAVKKLGWDQEKFVQQMENAQAAFGIKQSREERLSNKIQDANEAEAGANDVLAQLYRENKGPGTPDFEAEYATRMSPWLAKSASVRLTYNNMLHQANSVRDDNQRGIEASWKRFNENIGRKIGGGNVLNQNYDLFLHPENLEPVMEGWNPFDRHDTGKKYVPVQDAAGNAGKQVVDMSTLKDLQQEYQSILDREKRQASPIHIPDMGVRSAEPLPADRSKWEINHVYTSPKTGQPGRWNGSTFDPVGQ